MSDFMGNTGVTPPSNGFASAQAAETMKELIPLARDRRARAIKVLEGPLEHLRVAVTTSMEIGRVRFTLDGILIDARLREQHTTPQILQALADQRTPVLVGVFEMHDGTHTLDWLLPQGAQQPIAPEPTSVKTKKIRQSLPRALRLGVASGLIGAVALFLALRIESAWNLPFLIVAALATAALMLSLFQIAFSISTLWESFSRRQTLQLMASVMTKYCGEYTHDR
ncbi:hypothetical protein GNF76_22550 [Pseudomonas sp. CCM 7893]|uniref:Uncharacterized protein n=1 Tax=Pseudomonas spelaei TaxID=1055469 RepID=A0A6I3WA74_9PSED|nr:hypothetical protein [Pseudomonas spelaei]MUF07137.1 hypothetical protein [Pseudomonas spelaei]